MADIIKSFGELIAELSYMLAVTVYYTVKYTVMAVIKTVKITIKLCKYLKFRYLQRKFNKENIKIDEKNLIENKENIKEGNFSIVRENGKYILKIGEEN
jgi:hypothetical protein